jgi:hypothetical protein
MSAELFRGASERYDHCFARQLSSWPTRVYERRMVPFVQLGIPLYRHCV